MSELITVNISDAKVATCPGTLVTYALGSCIGICLYDTLTKTGGLAHIMLPHFPDSSSKEQIHRYADTCLPDIVRQMEISGCSRSRMLAKIAGGAKMFNVADDSAFGNIGKRNIEAVKETLSLLRIRMVAEDVGLNYGRTLYFHTETGEMVVKSFSQGTKTY
jgi:chemotaxis protein CheD